MTKKVGRSPKEARVSVQAEARAMLWAAVPRRMGDNCKSWTLYAAHKLGWKARRVRAIWNEEARVIRAEEWIKLNEEFSALNESAARRLGALHDLDLLARSVSETHRDHSRRMGMEGGSQGEARPGAKRSP